MKKIVSALLLSLTIIACSKEESKVETKTQQTLLKTYTLKKDANGSYSLDYTVNPNTQVDYVNKDNSNEIHLNASKSNSKTAYNESYVTIDKLKIGFFDNAVNKKEVILVEDENIVLTKKSATSDDFLNNYSITANGDNSYELKFEVEEGVAVSYNYDENNHIYEIHLQESENDNEERNFSKTYTKESNTPLKIDFVNYAGENTSKGNELEARPRRPRVIILD